MNRIVALVFLLITAFVGSVFAASTPLGPLPVTDGAVNAIHQDNGRLYIAGQFSVIASGFSRNGLAAIDMNTGDVVGSWSPSLSAGGVANVLLPSADGKVLFIGGQFSQVDGLARGHIAAINIDSASSGYGQVLDWNPDLTGVEVLALALSTDGQTLYVGGEFSQVGSDARQNLAAVAVSSGLASPWLPNPDGPVHDILVLPESSQVLVAGAFSHIGSSDGRDIRVALALLNPGNAAVISSWDTAVSGTAVYDVELMGGSLDVLVAGQFSQIGGLGRSNLARLELATATARAGWQVDTNGSVRQVLESNNGQLFVGGEFTVISGANRHYLAMLEGDDGTLLSWDPLIASMAGPAEIVALTVVTDNNSLTVAGNFTDIGGDSQYQNMARFLIAPPVTVSNPAAMASQFPLTVSLGCTSQVLISCVSTYVTVDGSTPTKSSPLYSDIDQLTIDKSMTVKYFSVDSDGNRESIHSDNYIIDQDKPQVIALPGLATLNAMTYGPVELVCDDGGSGSGCAAIHYTVDGSVATLNSPVYDGPIDLADGVTMIHYIAVDQAGNVGDDASYEYTVDREVPIISLSHESGDYNPPLTILMSCDDGGGEGCGELQITMDGSNPAVSANTPLTVSYTEPLALTFNSATVLRVLVKDNAGNEGESIVGIYSFTDATPLKRRGSGTLSLVWLLIGLAWCYRRLRRTQASGENAAYR